MPYRTAGDCPRATSPAAVEQPPKALPAPLGRPLALVGVAAAAVVAVLAVHYAGAAGGAVDRWIQGSVVFRLDWAQAPAVAVDFIGEPLGMAIVLALIATLCLVLRRPRLAALAVAGPLLSGAATTALKPVVGRTIHGEHLAYPSGHTAAATALSLVLALLLVSQRATRPRSALALVLTAATAGGLTMGWSQVYLWNHYPTDTLGGFATALVVVPAAALLIDRSAGWLHRRKERSRTFAQLE